MNIFTNDSERQQYLNYLKTYKQEYGMIVLAYALMPNHFHLVMESAEGRLSSFMGALQSTYAAWFNQQGNRESGRLFQSRFYSELVQTDEYFSTVLRYVLTNPSRSGFDSDEAVHDWTSLRELSSEGNIVNWDEVFGYLEHVETEDFENFLNQDLKKLKEKYQQMKRNVRDVNFIGDDQFLENLLSNEERETRKSNRAQSPVDSDEILDSVCELFGIDQKGTLLESVGERKHADARYTCFYLLRARGYLSLQEIGDRFDISQASVSEGIQRFEERIKDKDKIESLLKEWNL